MENFCKYSFQTRQITLKIRMKRYKSLIFALCCFVSALAQDIPEHISYTRVYDFVDELAIDGIVEVNSVIKPYSRNFIAQKLAEASKKDSLLNKRQKSDLKFFMSEFAIELDTMPKAYVHWTDKKSFDLSLLQPQFMYRDKYFKCQVRPIIGMDLLYNRHGLIMKRWYGADIQMDIVKHVSVWGSIRDISFNGDYLNDTYFPDQYAKINGAKISQSGFLNDLPGCAYKESNSGGDYSDFRGGIKAYVWWGSIGLVKDNIVWGDNYHGSNIISGRAPSFPMITLNLKPCKWFEFNYIHGWMVSNVIDSSYYYNEEQYTDSTSKRHYRPMNKFIAANMFTFTPYPKLNISIGNSIIYAERSVQAIYFIPFAFFKSLDHLMTKDLRVENQNSQIFINVSSRNIKHLHLYASFFIDEFSINRWKPDNKERNLVSYKAGFNLSNWPVKNLAVNFEYTRSNILTYKHSIDAITWASNDYNLGHYLGDNSQEFFVSVNYKPIRSLNLNLSYTNSQKGRDYKYVRTNTKEILSQDVLNEFTYKNEIVALKAVYEVWNNAYAVLNVEYNNARGYDVVSDPIEGENRLTAQGYLDAFSPKFYQGENWTLTVGFSIGF